jgi:hypothetical protein
MTKAERELRLLDQRSIAREGSAVGVVGFKDGDNYNRCTDVSLASAENVAKLKTLL